MKHLSSLMLSATALLSNSALAAPVTSWDFDVSLSWVTEGEAAPQFTTGNGLTYADDTLLSWGASGGDHTDQHASSSRSRSALQISDALASGTLDTNGTIPAATNTITHFNNTIRAAFSTLTDATLVSTLTLRPNDGTESELPFTTFFDIQFTEVLNQAQCPFPSASVCDDIFVLTGGSLTHSFVHDGYRYSLSIVETTSSLGVLHPDACLTAGANPGCEGFLTRENAFTPAQFGLLITNSPVPIPEPGMMALLGMGLLALGLTRRRQRCLGGCAALIHPASSTGAGRASR